MNATLFCRTLQTYTTLIIVSYPHGDSFYWQQRRWLLFSTLFQQINKAYTVLEDYFAKKDKQFVGEKLTIVDLAFVEGHFYRLEESPR